MTCMLSSLPTSLNLSSSITDDSICTHPLPAGGEPASQSTSFGSSFYSVTSTCEYTTQSLYLAEIKGLSIYSVTPTVSMSTLCSNACVYCEHSS